MVYLFYTIVDIFIRFQYNVWSKPDNNHTGASELISK